MFRHKLPRLIRPTDKFWEEYSSEHSRETYNNSARCVNVHWADTKFKNVDGHYPAYERTNRDDERLIEAAKQLT